MTQSTACVMTRCPANRITSPFDHAIVLYTHIDSRIYTNWTCPIFDQERAIYPSENHHQPRTDVHCTFAICTYCRWIYSLPQKIALSFWWMQFTLILKQQRTFPCKSVGMEILERYIMHWRVSIQTWKMNSFLYHSHQLTARPIRDEKRIFNARGITTGRFMGLFSILRYAMLMLLF